MVSKRQEELLKLIVEDYIKTARPVGSKALCDSMKCSSATIRSEMNYLEEIGLLEKTHISSGRVPSEKGYRYYVDNIMTPRELNGEDMLKLQTIVDNKSLVVNDIILKSMEIISELTHYTTVVLGKKSSLNLVQKVEVIPIDKNNIVAIVVTDKGHVEHKNIKLQDVSLEEVKKTVALINNLISGTPIDEINLKLEYEIKPIIGNYVRQHEQLYNAFYHVFNDFTNQEVNIVGRNKFLEQPEFSSNITKIKNVFNKLEDKKLLRDITEDGDNNIRVYIGNESNIDSDVTVIKTTFKNGNEEGTIAIIGPKRMEYDRVVSMLEYMKENIER